MTDYLALARADADLLLKAVAEAGDAAVVPTCPDWKTADLVAHVAGVFHRIETTVRLRAQERLSAAEVGDAPPLDEALAALVDTLSSVPPDEPVWNWSVNQPKVAAFWPRRVACETAIHRVDAQSAVGPAAVTPIDAELAVDAMDELLDVILRARVAFGVDAALGGSIHFHCTDVEGEWLVSVADGSVDITRSHAKGDAAVRGPASDVLRWAYNRGGAVETFGDPAVLAAWQSAVRF